MLFQGDDETYSEAISRLLSHPPDTEALLTTIISRAPSDYKPGEREDTIRRRIRGDAEDKLRSRMDDEGATASEALEGVFNPDDWSGFDLDAYMDSHPDSLAHAMRKFVSWYEEDDRTGPPTAVDVGDWFVTLDAEKEGWSEGTIGTLYAAARSYAIFAGANEAMAAVWAPPRELQIEAVNDLEQRKGRTPRSRDVAEDDSSILRIGHLQSEFGSFNDALREAGFEPNEEKTGPFTPEELLDDLVEFYEDLGHEPDAQEMTEDGPHSLSTYYNHFGGLTRAKKIAGIRDFDVNDIVYLSIIEGVGPVGEERVGEEASETFGREVRGVEEKIDLLEMAGLVEETDAGYAITADGEDELAASDWSQAVSTTAP